MKKILVLALVTLILMSTTVLAVRYIKRLIKSDRYVCPSWAKKCRLEVYKNNKRILNRKIKPNGEFRTKFYAVVPIRDIRVRLPTPAMPFD